MRFVAFSRLDPLHDRLAPPARLNRPGADQTPVIRGEQPCQTPGDARFLRVERGHGAFVGSFSLPRPVRAREISAEFPSGVLTVFAPKVRPQTRRIRID